MDWNNKEEVLKILEQDGMALEHVSEELKNDKDVALTAVRSNARALKFLTVENKNYEEIVRECVKKEGFYFILSFLDKKFKFTNKDYAMEAVKDYGFAINYVSDELKNDRELALAAVKNNGYSYKAIADKFKADEEIVCEAIKQKGSMREICLYIPEGFEFKNKKFALEAVKADAEALTIVCEKFKSNKKIVSAAVGKDISALENASNKLRNNQRFVLKLAKLYRYAVVRHADKSLYTNLKFMSKLGKIRDNKKTISIFDDKGPENE